jgi:hypothetical protein
MAGLTWVICPMIDYQLDDARPQLVPILGKDAVVGPMLLLGGHTQELFLREGFEGPAPF